MTEKITIDAPRALVFGLISDLSARPAFTDHFIHDYHLQRVEPVGVGASARFRIDAGRGTLWMETVVAELEAPHRLLEQGAGGRGDKIPLHTAWTLLEGPSGTELNLTYWSDPGSPLERIAAAAGAPGKTRRDWRKALKRLKELAETGGTVERIEVGGGPRVPVRR